MGWLVVSILIAGTIASLCGFALARVMYGSAIGRDVKDRASARRDEHRFLPADVQELDEAFNRVLRSRIFTD